MITLDSTLNTAQNSLVRNPIIALNSTAFFETIPFEGQLFNSSSTTENSPEVISASSGRIVSVFERSNIVYLLLTDTDRIEWFEYPIYAPTTFSSSILRTAITELEDGTFGVVIIRPITYSSDAILTTIVNDSGQVLAGASTLVQTNNWKDGVSVAYTGTEYLLIYAYKDGLDQYSIQQTTSLDFITWTTPTILELPGLDLSRYINNLTIRRLESGELLIVFDHLENTSGSEEMVNIYWIRSMNGGATWTDPAKLTTYSIYGTLGRHPSLAERDDGTIVLAYQEEKNVLFMNSGTVGWDDGYSTVSGGYFNPSTGKIVIKTGYTGMGGKPFNSLIVVDAASWTIDKCYNATSENPISYGGYGFQWNAYDDGKWCVVYKSGIIAVLNLETDIWRYYVWADQPAFELLKNIDITGMTSFPVGMRVIGDKLYIEGWTNYAWHNRFSIGWIDLTIEMDPVTKMYDAWNFIVLWNYGFGIYAGYQRLAYHPEVNMMVRSSAHTIKDRANVYLQVLNFQGQQVYYFTAGTHSGFPARGMAFPIIVNNHIYGDVEYEPNYGNGARYGLCDIDLETLEFKYHRPTYATRNNYNLGRPKDMGDGRIMFAVEPWDGGYGISIFNTITTEWEIFDTTTLPGLAGHAWWYTDYDPVERIIYSAGYHGLTAFSEDGEFTKVFYKIISKATGSWVQGSTSALLNDQNNSEVAITVDNLNVLWAMATKKHNGGELSLCWDCELAEKDLAPFLTNDAVSLNWEVDGINSLSFTLSHGHLFEPSNTMSTITMFVKKGRRIVIALGERINDGDYFQNQGTFVVTETSLRHTKGSYPVISVNCEDARAVWRQKRIVTSEFYSNQVPIDIISDILQTFVNVEFEDINLPSIYNSHNLYHQFIDQDVTEMIEEIVEHFNYFFFVDVNGQYTLRRFNLAQGVHHTYTGAELISYSPDDTYSSFVNQVTVKGEGRYEIEVLYPTELIQAVNGTVGWWGGDKTLRIWFSEDHEKQCRHAKLEVKESVGEFSIFGQEGGGSESITATDYDDYWVEITIECPNLMGMIAGTAVMVLIVGIMAISCRFSCGIYIMMLSLLTNILSYMLAAIAQYEYEIWANPIGYSKQTFQASADDYVFQRELNGLVVEEVIDDPFCYDLGRCQVVADNELAIVKAQRSRLSFEKITHLQDEIGDTLQVQHPYTQVGTKIFTTAIKRTYQKGRGIFDVIEGWRLV